MILFWLPTIGEMDDVYMNELLKKKKRSHGMYYFGKDKKLKSSIIIIFFFFGKIIIIIIIIIIIYVRNKHWKMIFGKFFSELQPNTLKYFSEIIFHFQKIFADYYFMAKQT
jgi:hypothetical protein